MRSEQYLVEHALPQRLQETDAFFLIERRLSDAIEQIQSLLGACGLGTRFIHSAFRIRETGGVGVLAFNINPNQFPFFLFENANVWTLEFGLPLAGQDPWICLVLRPPFALPRY